MDPRSSFSLRLRPSPIGFLLGALLVLWWAMLITSCLVVIGVQAPEAPAARVQSAAAQGTWGA